MIETTYVRLEKAAEMLGTDRDTLLLAAVEGRVKLFGLFGHSVWAIDYTTVDLNIRIDAYLESGIMDQVQRHSIDVTYVRVARDDAVQLLRHGSFRPSFFESQTYFPAKYSILDWLIDSPDDEVPLVNVSDLLMKSVDLQAIINSQKLPEPNTIPVQKPYPASKRTDKTLHRIIGGMLQMITKGTDENGERISKYTQEKVIAYLEDKYPMAHGLKKSHLEKTFGEANRIIRET